MNAAPATAPPLQIYPVVHVHDCEPLAEVAKARRHGVAGVFLIDHDADDARLVDAIAAVTKEHPDFFIGANFIRRPIATALNLLGRRFRDGLPVNAIWADFVDPQGPTAPSDWNGLHFGGVAFKHQAAVELNELPAAARAVRNHVDVATTSGSATGQAAAPERIAALREGLGDCPVALASGVTPENVSDYRGLVDHVLVASGIAGSDGLDESKLARLMSAAH